MAWTMALERARLPCDCLFRAGLVSPIGITRASLSPYSPSSSLNSEPIRSISGCEICIG